jgi:4-amino-4-deoxy-L-arabinose transferase-like glycosyltransferase
LLFGVLLLALAVRLAIVLPVIGLPPQDPDHYLTLARSLVDGRGFSLVGRLTAYRPPLYPLILTPFVALFGERTAAPALLLNVLLGVGTAACTFVTARRWGFSGGRAALAGLIVACDPVLVVQAKSVMTETLAAFLLSGALMTVSRDAGPRRAFGGGIWLGLASLCRPSLLASSALISAAALAFGPGTARLRLLRSAGILAGTLIVLTPWAARNARVFGEPIWTTTHGGYTLALANNPAYYRDVLDGEGGEVWTGPGQKKWAEGVLRRTRGLPEPEADRRLSAEGWRMARIAPGAFARATVARLKRFWGVTPARSVYALPLRVATGLWTAPLLFAVGAGLASRRAWRWPRATAVAAIVSLTIVHAFYWTDLRMRAPIVPALALIAAGAALPGWKSAENGTGRGVENN